MGKYTDDEIRGMKKITCKISADYLGISPKFAEPTFTDRDKTLADIVEDIINNDFTQLPIEEDEDKIRTKPVRSTGGRER